MLPYWRRKFCLKPWCSNVPYWCVTQSCRVALGGSKWMFWLPLWAGFVWENGRDTQVQEKTWFYFVSRGRLWSFLQTFKSPRNDKVQLCSVGLKLHIFLAMVTVACVTHCCKFSPAFFTSRACSHLYNPKIMTKLDYRLTFPGLLDLFLYVLQGPPKNMAKEIYIRNKWNLHTILS